MSHFYKEENRKWIEQNINLSRYLHSLYDLEEQCGAVRAISAVSYMPKIVYEDNGFPHQRTFSKEELDRLLPDLGNFPQMTSISLSLEPPIQQPFIQMWPRSLTSVDLRFCSSSPNLLPLNDLPMLDTLGLLGKNMELRLGELEGLSGRLKNLFFVRAADMERIAAFQNLEALGCGSCRWDPAAVGKLKKLRYLSVEQLQNRSLDGLKGCENLEMLHIQGEGVRDIRAIAELPRLRRLWLSASEVSGLSCLTGLPLTELILSPCPVLDFEPLNSLNGLTRLSLPHSHLSDLRLLSGMRELRILDLTHNMDVTALSPLSELKELQSLNLSEMVIRDLSPLAALPKLKRLNLYKCRGLTDLSPLFQLSSLEKVTMSYCPENMSLTDSAPKWFQKIVQIEC